MSKIRPTTDRSTRPRRLPGFTLIELLVVIAIIALLVSILMPSLAKAKVLAKRSMCALNIRSLCYAETLYSQDNDDYYTNNEGRGSDGTWESGWWFALDDYVIGNKSRFVPCDMGAFACPSSKYVPSMPDGPNYGVNSHLWAFSIGTTNYPAVRASMIKIPAVSGLFVDQNAWTPYGYTGPCTYIWNLNWSPSPRHHGQDSIPNSPSFGLTSKGLFNAGYADSHVSLEDYQTFMVLKKSEKYDIPWYYSLPGRS